MAGASEFIERTTQLAEKIGRGKIQASVKVDQVYAEMQHNAVEFKHRRGGKAGYLRDPLFLGTPKWLQGVANRLYDRRMVSLFEDIANDLSGGVAHEAPVFMGDLANSGEPRVKEGGAFVWRGTSAPRLSKTYADAKIKMWHHLYGEGG